MHTDNSISASISSLRSHKEDLSTVHRLRSTDEEDDTYLKAPLFVSCQKEEVELGTQSSQNLESSASCDVTQIFDFIVLPGIDVIGKPLIGVHRICVAKGSSNSISNCHQPNNHQIPVHCKAVELGQQSKSLVTNAPFQSFSWHTGVETQRHLFKKTAHKTLRSAKKTKTLLASRSCHILFDRCAHVTNFHRCQDICHKICDKTSQKAPADPLFYSGSGTTKGNLETCDVIKSNTPTDPEILQGSGADNLELLVVTYDMEEPLLSAELCSPNSRHINEEPGVDYDPLYNCAFEFARSRGYGFVEFVEERPDGLERKKRSVRKKLKLQTPLAKKDDRVNPVYAVISAHNKCRIHHTKCMAKPRGDLTNFLSDKSLLMNHDSAAVKHFEADMEKVKSQSPALKTSCPDLMKEHSLQKNRHRMNSKTRSIATAGTPKFSHESPEETHDIIQSSSLNDIKEHGNNRCQKGKKKNFKKYDVLSTRSKSTGVGDVLNTSEKGGTRDKLDKTFIHGNNSSGCNAMNNQSEELKQSVLRVKYSKNKISSRDSRFKALDTNTSKKNASDSSENISDTSVVDASFFSRSSTVLPRLRDDTSLKYKMCNSISATIFRESQLAQKTFTTKKKRSDKLPTANIDVVHFAHQHVQRNDKNYAGSCQGTARQYGGTYRKPKTSQHFNEACFTMGTSARRDPQILLGHTHCWKRRNDKAESWPNIKICSTGGLNFSTKVKIPVCRSPGMPRLLSSIGDSPTQHGFKGYRSLEVLPEALRESLGTGAYEQDIKALDGSSVRSGIYPASVPQVREHCKLYQSFESCIYEDRVAREAASSLSCTSRSSKESLESPLRGTMLNRIICRRRSATTTTAADSQTSVNNNKSDVPGQDLAGVTSECSCSNSESVHNEQLCSPDANNNALPYIQKLPNKNNSFVCKERSNALNSVPDQTTNSVKVSHQKHHPLGLPILSNKCALTGCPHDQCLCMSSDNAGVSVNNPNSSKRINRHRQRKLRKSSKTLPKSKTVEIEKLPVLAKGGEHLRNSCKAFSNRSNKRSQSRKGFRNIVLNKSYLITKLDSSSDECESSVDVKTPFPALFSPNVNRERDGSTSSGNDGQTTIKCTNDSDLKEERHFISLSTPNNINAKDYAGKGFPRHPCIISLQCPSLGGDQALIERNNLVNKSALKAAALMCDYDVIPQPRLCLLSPNFASKSKDRNEVCLSIGGKFGKNSSEESSCASFEYFKMSQAHENTNNSAKKNGNYVQGVPVGALNNYDTEISPTVAVRTLSHPRRIKTREKSHDCSLVVSQHVLKNKCPTLDTNQKEHSVDRSKKASGSVLALFPTIQFNEFTEQSIGTDNYVFPQEEINTEYCRSHKSQQKHVVERRRIKKEHTEKSKLIRKISRSKILSPCHETAILCMNNNAKTSRKRTVTHPKRTMRQSLKRGKMGNKPRRKVQETTYSVAPEGRRYLQRRRNETTYLVTSEGYKALYEKLLERCTALQQRVPIASCASCRSSMQCSCNVIEKMVDNFRQLITLFPAQRLRALQNILGLNVTTQSSESSCSCSESKVNENAVRQRKILYRPRPGTIYHSLTPCPDFCYNNTTAINGMETCSVCSSCGKVSKKVRTSSKVDAVDSLTLTRERLPASKKSKKKKSKNVSKNACCMDTLIGNDNSQINDDDLNLPFIDQDYYLKLKQLASILARNQEKVNFDTSSDDDNDDENQVERSRGFLSKFTEGDLSTMMNNLNKDDMKRFLRYIIDDQDLDDDDLEILRGNAPIDVASYTPWNGIKQSQFQHQNRSQIISASRSESSIDENVAERDVKSEDGIQGTANPQHIEELKRQKVQRHGHCEPSANKDSDNKTSDFQSLQMEQGSAPSQENLTSVMQNYVNGFFGNFSALDDQLCTDARNKGNHNTLRENADSSVNESPLLAKLKSSKQFKDMQPNINALSCTSTKKHGSDRQSCVNVTFDSPFLESPKSCLQKQAGNPACQDFVDTDSSKNVVKDKLNKPSDTLLATAMKGVVQERRLETDLNDDGLRYVFEEPYLKVNPPGLSTKWVCFVPNSCLSEPRDNQIMEGDCNSTSQWSTTGNGGAESSSANTANLTTSVDHDETEVFNVTSGRCVSNTRESDPSPQSSSHSVTKTSSGAEHNNNNTAICYAPFTSLQASNIQGHQVYHVAMDAGHETMSRAPYLPCCAVQNDTQPTRQRTVNTSKTGLNVEPVTNQSSPLLQSTLAEYKHENDQTSNSANLSSLQRLPASRKRCREESLENLASAAKIPKLTSSASHPKVSDTRQNEDTVRDGQ